MNVNGTSPKSSKKIIAQSSMAAHDLYTMKHILVNVIRLRLPAIIYLLRRNYFRRRAKSDGVIVFIFKFSWLTYVIFKKVIKFICFC